MTPRLSSDPEAFDIVGMHFAAHVFMRFVVNRIVWESLAELLIARALIGRDQTNLVRNCIADEPAHSLHRSIFDDFADHIALAGDRADDRGLAGRATPRLFLIPMAIAVQSADVSFIHFHDSHQLAEIGIGQTGTQPMAHEPCGAVRAGTDHAMNLKRADALLAGQHQIQNLEPYEQLVVRVLKDGPDQHGESIGRIAAFLADPVERARLERIDLFVPAARATDALWPAARDQIRLAGVLVREQAVKFRQSHLTRDFRFGGVAHEK